MTLRTGGDRRMLVATTLLASGAALLVACSDDAPAATAAPGAMAGAGALPAPAAGAEPAAATPMAPASPPPDPELPPLQLNPDRMTFFVSSDTSKTGNLGGLKGADARCQRLATAAGAGNKTWVAYLSVEHDPDNGNGPTHAVDRIGIGPYYDAWGEGVASDLDGLLTRSGDPGVFIDEYGNWINGYWEGSPGPAENDILTGSSTDGRLMPGLTCKDWTSESPEDFAQVGHSDGLGPGNDRNPPYGYWNSLHKNGGCHDTSLLGGAGRIYCVAP